MFDNVAKPLLMLKDPELHGHVVLESLFTLSPGTPMVVLFVISLFFALATFH